MADQNWDVTKPIDHTKISVLPEEIRGLRSSIKTIIQKEHVALGASNLGGQHLKGAARVYLSDSLPGSDPESNNLDTSATSDDGRIAIATGGGVTTGLTNTMKVYVATSAGISTSWKDVRAGYAGTAVRVSLDNDTFVKALTAGAPSTSIDMIKINSTGVLALSPAHASVLMTSTLPTVSGEVANTDYVDSAPGFVPNPAVGGDDSEGTVTFPSGLIMKWGSDSVNGGATDTVTFDVAFPNQCFQAFVSTENDSVDGQTSDEFALKVRTVQAANMTVFNSNANANTYRWFAIGR